MKFLSTGEFAELCETKKDTLIFYDRAGLLQPDHVSENGYRRYAVEQFYDFDLIAMLKETGSSLKEIKRHLQERNPEKLLLLFEEKKRLLQQEKARLAKRQKMLADITALTREALGAAYDTLELVQMEEECLEFVPLRSKSTLTGNEIASFLREHIEYFKEQGRTTQLPFGVFIPQEEVAAGIIRYFFNSASRATPAALLHVKPKGRYAVFCHNGVTATHTAIYKKMLAEIEKSGLRIAGGMYTYDMMSYLVAGTKDAYAVKYCVHVEKAGKERE